jgi:two-component system, chemotaxis family, protein-glutamate methylesterase/glutaminase
MLDPGTNIVAIGASAGGVKAISKLISLLPEDLPACVLVVLHRAPDSVSHLHHILAQTTNSRVQIPHGGEKLKPGLCLVAPTNHHMTIGSDHRVHLLPDTFYRSHSIDALFSSLARNSGRRTIGVVLSGLLKDGTLGLKGIKEAGGVALVQSPEEAEYPEMPNSAIAFDGPVGLGWLDRRSRQADSEACGTHPGREGSEDLTTRRWAFGPPVLKLSSVCRISHSYDQALG